MKLRPEILRSIAEGLEYGADMLEARMRQTVDNNAKVESWVEGSTVVPASGLVEVRRAGKLFKVWAPPGSVVRVEEA